MSMDLAFNILLSIAIAAIGFGVKRTTAQLDHMRTDADRDVRELRAKIEDVRVHYQTDAEADRNQQLIMAQLDNINRKLERIDEKLDKKADK